MGTVIGYDVNLGLAADFNQKLGVQSNAYSDLGKMLEAFVSQQLNAIFIPAGTLPYVKEPYDVIAQSTFGTSNSTTLKTILCSKNLVTFEDIPQLTLGRVNKYCTTSFWAPQIYLMELLKEGTTLKFQDTESFQDMLFKVAAQKVDAATVWDIIMQQNPEATKEVRQGFSVSNLPTPIIIAHPDCDPKLIQALTKFRSADEHAFFRGFIEPEYKGLTQFQQKMQKAATYFHVEADENVYSNST